MYGKALRALRDFPHPLTCGSDATQVKFIGPTIAKRLQTRLSKHCEELGVAVPEPESSVAPAIAVPSSATTAAPAKPKRKRAYVPRRRSGAHAILLVLFREGEKDSYRGFLSKTEIVGMAQPLCDASFTSGAGDSHYSAWASMKTLIDKSLVEKSGTGRYSLTFAGDELSRKLNMAEVWEHEDELGDIDADDVMVVSTSATSSVPKRSKTGVASSTAFLRRIGSATAASQAPPLEPNVLHTPTGPASGWGSRDGSLFSPVDMGRSLTDLTASDFDINGDGTGPSTKVPGLDFASTSSAAAGAAPVCSPLAPFSRKASSARQDEVHNSPSWVLLPGQFDVVLAIDTSEHTGSRKDKGVIQQKLAAMGVRTEVRRLALGDFLWLAKERVQPVPGQLALPLQRELVLEYVVERKRMDDLSSSICDGRFEEQKHRFKHAGIRGGVYLVEDYGRIDNHRLPADTLRQAMANTEVCDGFFLKHTADTAATVAYLVLMHRHVCARHERAAVVAKGLSVDAVLRKHPGATLAVTFDDFTALTLKTQVLSVQEMFVKQLMQMAGLTVEKAAAIVQLYPTPGALMAAYDALSNEKQRDALLEDIQFKEGPRSKIGPAISTKVSRLYNDDVLL